MLRLLTLALFCLTGCEPDREDWPSHCSNPGREDVRYLHDTWAERDECMWTDFFCPTGTEFISGAYPEIINRDCGCGCTGDPELLGDFGLPQPDNE